jgi:hypothetical protein|tara:strand:+ start:180 stop:1307 length:1128 start_codon:yes stop_codon:yes gene_type:complete
MADAKRDANFIPTLMGVSSVDSTTPLPVKINASGEMQVEATIDALEWTTDVATGTDGELVTWDASGDPATVAVGTSGHVLTSNGAGAAPTFQANGTGDVSKVGTPADSQVGVWTGDGTIEGAASLTYDGSNLQLTGDIGSTGTRITKGWFTDLQVTNSIAGSITGNAATVSTITGLAPDTATTQATQASITTCANLTTVGTLVAGDVDAAVSAADLTTAGKIEIATAAETTTGTDATRAVSPDGLAGSEFGERAVQVVPFDFTTDTATGNGKFYFHIDSRLAGMNLVDVHAEVITAGTTGTLDIQIHNLTQTADMLSTKLTVDSGETGSDTAATPAVIDTGNDDVAENDVIRIDVDAVHTTPAKGLLVTMGFRTP